MEEISDRVQKATTKIFTELDRDLIRQMQGDMHRCSAKCCDVKTSGLDDVQRCVENCSIPLTQAQNFMQQEVENFQDRLNRCAKDCQDKLRDNLPSTPAESQMVQFRKELESCVSSCADDHIRKLPDLAKRLKSNISSMK
ncbi:protein FAM136A-like [Ruditapes philippinarum]|uniref:protein FAM136A-like n=1 Tax=Ruditapes philippinarum TaxID=129788 RepID=UPI00295A5D84|nr:protein FAM136A-like [Ruditapes philippinarum]